MATKLRRLVITKVDLCKAGADPDAHIEIFKSLDTPETTHSEETTMSKKIDFATASNEQLVEYAKSLEQQVETLEKGKVACSDDEPDGDEMPPAGKKPVKKSVVAIPESVQKTLDDQSEQIKKQAEQLKEQGETIAKERESREIGEMLTFVQKSLPSVPGKAEDLAKALHTAKAKLPAETYDILLKALSAGNEAITKSFKEVGADDAVAVGSAMEEINKRADALLSSGVAKTRPEAIAEVAKANPELYTRYKAEDLAKTIRR